MPQAKKPKLTVKETKLVKGIVEGKTKQQAALDAYDTTDPATASVIASNTLKKVNVQEALQAEMAKQGITLDKIIKPIKDGLEAEKVHIVGNGDQAMAEITPDHSIRLKSSQMAQTLLGANKNQEGGGININFINIAKEDKDAYGI